MLQCDIELERDFFQLRSHVREARLFQSSRLFFGFQFIQIIALEIVAYLLLAWYGVSWSSIGLSAALLGIAQVRIVVMYLSYI
jgi:hypothetical protein